MKVCARQFNIYFALAAMFALLCGCQTDKAPKDVAALRVHIETNPGPTGTSQNVSVLRSDPVQVTIANEPVLTEANIVAARVVDSTGGFAIEIQFDENGTWTLEQFSAANPGKHFAVFGLWGEKLVNGRWLAAPLITRHIADGLLAFTPDMSRTEADQLVLGLNNAAKKNKKGSFK
jgi:preprotein translocase subunit SecD